MLRKTNRVSDQNQGFILPIVVVTGLVIGAGLMALSTQTFSSLIGSVRQGQNREAQEAAETGLAVIIKELNTSFPYLLTDSCLVDASTGTCQGWIHYQGGGTWAPTVSRCPNTSNDPGAMQSKLQGNIQGGRSRYQLLSYRFTGDKNQGGVGVFTIKGERYAGSESSPQIRSTAVIEQSVNIVPKSCATSVNSPATSSGFPGLLAEEVNMGGNELLGAVNGNVLCTNCDPDSTSLENDINLNRQGVVEGEIFGGSIAMPDPPSFPASAVPSGVTVSPRTITATTTLVPGSSNGGACFTDSDSVTHCRITQINLGSSSGGRGGGSSPILCIFTNAGNHSNPCDSGRTITVPINKGLRLYFETANSDNPSTTTCEASSTESPYRAINISGTSYITHIGTPNNLGMFGVKRSTCTNPTQQVTLAGGASGLGMFLYFPDALVGINGGSTSSTSDFIGALWARIYDGSNSKNVQLLVPPNMGSLIWTRYGSAFGLGVREFAALGSNSWRKFQAPM